MDLLQRARGATAADLRFGGGRHLQFYLLTYAGLWCAQTLSSLGEVAPWRLVAALVLSGAAALAALWLWHRDASGASVRRSALGVIVYSVCCAGTAVTWFLAPGFILGGTILVALVPTLVVAAGYVDRTAFLVVATVWLISSAALLAATRLGVVEAIFAVLLMLLPLALVISSQRLVHARCARHLGLLAHLANSDYLTGALNRRGLLEHFARWQRSEPRVPLSGVLVLDIDHFKRINDTLGHKAGDEILRSIGDAIRLCLLPGDIFSRSGGEEFAVLTSGDGRLMAERLRRVIDNLDLGGSTHVTVSLGALRGVPLEEVKPDQLWSVLGAADAALYRAKRLGRNRVEVGSLPATADLESWPAPVDPRPSGDDLARARDDIARIPARTLAFASVFVLIAGYLVARGLLVHHALSLAEGAAVLVLGAVAVVLCRSHPRSPRVTFAFLLLVNIAVGIYGTAIHQPLTWVAVVIIAATAIAVRLFVRGRLVRVHTVIVAVEVIGLYWFGPVGATAWWPLYALMSLVATWVMCRTVTEFNDLAVTLVAHTRSATFSDPLTRALNRRGLEHHVSESARNDLMVTVIDIDGFKALNDAHGHAHGDAVLCTLVLAVKAELCCRGSIHVHPSMFPLGASGSGVADGWVARVGGDEFVVVHPVSQPRLVERAAARLAATHRGVRISYGSAAWERREQSLWATVNEADQAMLRRRQHDMKRWQRMSAEQMRNHP
ncbi:GGDEF domain-containing protein [Micrococcales bacterium 31B]|nr:GGDEF domain-containing protein [Micrococcales bacterium 31B]